MHPPSPPTPDPLSPQIISKSISDANSISSYKTANSTSSNSPNESAGSTPVETPAEAELRDAELRDTGFDIEGSTPYSTPYLPAVDSEEYDRESSFQTSVIEEERLKMDFIDQMSTPGSSRRNSAEATGVPSTPRENTLSAGGGNIDPLSPDTPRFDEFMDFLRDGNGAVDTDDHVVSSPENATTRSNVGGSPENATTQPNVDGYPENGATGSNIETAGGSPTTGVSDPTPASTDDDISSDLAQLKVEGGSQPDSPHNVTASESEATSSPANFTEATMSPNASASPRASPSSLASEDMKQPAYHPPSYSNRYDPKMADFVSASDTKTKVGRRCYRLNLERPFDIHCEQSPLEYGDYMAPWSKSVYPSTVGPTEYCPPRHLGGQELVWRELMRWTEAAERECEEKVNSLDVLDSAPAEEEEDIKTKGSSKSLGSGVLSPNRGVVLDGEEDTSNEEKRGSADELEAKGNPASPTGGWRAFSATELEEVQKLGERTQYGEYTFQTYDLSHVALNTAGKTAANGHGLQTSGMVTDQYGNERSGVMVEGIGLMPLRTVFSMDSTTSEDEKANPKSEEEIQNDTARLFRRSELSLKEKAEREEREEAERQEKLRLAEIERQERERRERESGHIAADSTLDFSQRTARAERGHRRKFSSGGKKLFKQFSKAFSVDSTNSNLEASWRGSSSHRRSASRTNSGSGRPQMVKRSSMQALTIDKARDLVDDSDDEGSVVGAEDGEGDADKKPLNVSLYILGEYDVLNDLVNDGAKRLRDNKESSDLDLLLQNEPCPAPDRWVRKTGWSKCNPSSTYAKDPPSDFDWIRYGDKLRLRTDEYRDGFQETRTRSSSLAAAAGEQPQDGSKGTTTDTEGTDLTAAASLSDGDFEEDERHRVGGRLTRVTRAGSSASSNPTPSVDDAAPKDNLSASARPAGTGGGARGHFNKSAAAGDSLSASARPAKSGGARGHFNSSKSTSSANTATSASDGLSKSARTPRSSSSSSAVKSGGFRTSTSSAASRNDNLSASARTPRTNSKFNAAKQGDSLSASAHVRSGSRSSRGGMVKRLSLIGRKK